MRRQLPSCGLILLAGSCSTSPSHVLEIERAEPNEEREASGSPAATNDLNNAAEEPKENLSEEETVLFVGVTDSAERRALLLIYRCPDMWEGEDPAAVVRAVNALVPLGKDRALSALRRYHDIVGDRWSLGKAANSVAVVCVAFMARVGERPLEPPPIGFIAPPVSERAGAWQNWPMVLVQGLPLFISQGSSGTGAPPSALRYLDYLRDNAELRTTPLVPPDNPIDAIDGFIQSEAWRGTPLEGESPGKKWYFNREWIELLMRSQALNAVRDIYQPAEDIVDQHGREGTHSWKFHVAQIRQLNPRWDSERQTYVEGQQHLPASRLPQPFAAESASARRATECSRG